MAELSAEAIIAEATTLAWLPDPDVAPFRSNLDLLVDCINEEAELRPAALSKVQHRLALSLRNQLEVSDWVRRHPAIREERIEQPIFLTGLPRSGTTYPVSVRSGTGDAHAALLGGATHLPAARLRA